MVSSNFLVRGNVRDLLFFIASLDALVGITALQVVYALFRPDGSVGGAAPGQLTLVMAAVGLGVVMGIVFLWLVRRRPRAEELVLFVLGICAFAAGAALQWGLSPLFVSVVMGAVVANVHRDRQRVFTLLERWEKPVYLTFLLLAGALLHVPSGWVLLLALAYGLLRVLTKGAASAALVTVTPLGMDVPRRLGLGLVPQGGIALAMAVSGVLMYPDVRIRGTGAEMALFTIVAVGVLLSELSGPFLTVKLLRRAGEISPRVEEALAEGDQRRAEREAIRHTIPPDRVSGEGDD
jgi:Kef-type K+ transport system membrane component KefB